MDKISGVEIVKRIDFLLSERNESRNDLCKFTGILKQNISHWFTRDSVPKADDIFLIAEYLHCSPSFLLFGEDRKTNQRTQSLCTKFEKLSEIEKTTVESVIDGFLKSK